MKYKGEHTRNLGTKANRRRVRLEACPYCCGRDICAGNEFEKVYTASGEFVRQRAACENCGREWWDVFVLSHVEAPAAVVTEDHLKEWRAFCEWLDQRPRKCAYQSAVPEKWSQSVYVGGNPTGQNARDVRHTLGLIFYRPGWGWRLRKGWRERLRELENNFGGE